MIIFNTDKDVELYQKYMQEDGIDGDVFEFIADINRLEFKELVEEWGKIEGEFLAFATVQTWQGTKKAFSNQSFNNLGDLLIHYANYDDIKIYTENNQLKMDLVHHDGTNRLTIKKLNSGRLERSWKKITYLGLTDFDYVTSQYCKNPNYYLSNINLKDLL